MIDITDKIIIRMYFPNGPSLLEFIIDKSVVFIEGSEELESELFDNI